LAIAVGSPLHVLLEIEQDGNVMATLAQFVRGGHAVGSVDEMDFTVGPDD
jgi:hypothetical protein